MIAQATRIGLSRRWPTLTTRRLRCVALRSSRGSTASRGRQSWSLLVASEYGITTPTLTYPLDIKETGEQNSWGWTFAAFQMNQMTELSMKDKFCSRMNDERRAEYVIHHFGKLGPTFDVPERSTTGKFGTHVLVDISSWYI